MSFVVGLGVGFVLGARAGRERYDQLVKMAQSTRENPQFQQATATIQTQAASLLSSASQKVTEMAPQFAQSAMHKVGDITHRNGHGGSGSGTTGAASDSPFASTGNPSKPAPS